MARIAIGGFQHETNTFATAPGTYEEFVKPGGWPGLTRGEAIFDVFATNSMPISGFIREASRRGHALVPLAWAMAVPCGRVTDDAFERISAMIVADLAAQTPVDAVYLDLHGAAVIDSHEDGEGELLRRVRAVIGPDTVLAASLDLHANVTELMMREADLITAYRTYPHVDTAETGARAAVLLDEQLTGQLSGRARRGKALRKLPFLIPLTAQCSLVDPTRAIYAGFAAIEAATGASVSFTPGFPPADIRDCGPAVFAFAPDQARADAAADAVAAQVLAAERAFGDEILAPDTAVARAVAIAARAGKPVVLADTQDNPGAGGPSDTVGLLEALIAGGAQGAVMAVLYDPECAAMAHAAGVGAEIELALGGKNQMPGHRPLRGRFKVKALGDGNFVARGPMLDGAAMQLGPMALLGHVDDKSQVDIIVGSARQQPYTQSIFHHLGLEPAAQKILALKSSVHFRAAFQDIAETVMVVAAPGVNLADPRDFAYRHLRPGVRLVPGGAVSR
ncbi:MAG TPA: M81 family metallopeptidase [Candidatus Sulfotelmatobacter sp.]|nr:M81 family metallopeptidase [Candidatus Sulfotelmatobacter sp.]